MKQLRESLIGKHNDNNAVSANKIEGILSKRSKKVPAFNISFVKKDESSIGPRYEFLAEVKKKEKQDPNVIGQYAHDIVLTLLEVFNEMGFFPSKELVHIDNRYNKNNNSTYTWNNDVVECNDIAKRTEELITDMFYTNKICKNSILKSFNFNIYVSKLNDKVCYIVIKSYVNEK